MCLTAYTRIWLICLIQLLSCHSIEPHCPVTITELTADFEPRVLMTPGYEEGSYPLFLDCSWNISTNFVGVDILSELDVASIPCDSKSSVSIYDGLDTDGVLLQRNGCGRDVKVVKIGESGSLHIKFVTDESTAKGFTLKYMAAKDNSGTGVVQQLDATTDKQYISSALFPMAYPSGETRTYVVSSGHSSSHVIMNVVYINISPSCTDSLEIFDGDRTVDAGAPSLGLFCSNNEKWPEQVNYRSTGQYLTAVFTAVTGDEGFFLHYYDPYHCPDETHDITANSFPGELKSPGYDDGRHLTYMECAWTVSARVQGTPVLLQMVDVGLGTGAGVSIYDGNDTNGILLQELSGIGQNHPMIIAESGTAFLKLRTEAASEARGFLLKYMASSDMSETSHVTTLDEEQYLSSTSFPHLYPGTDNRVWVISTDEPKKKIKISILFMDVVDSSKCTGGDALKIYDGEYMVGMEYNPTMIDVVCRESSWSTIEYQNTGQYISLVLELDSVSSNNRHGYLLAYKHIDGPYAPEIKVTQPVTVSEGDRGVQILCEADGIPNSYNFGKWRQLGPTDYKEIRILYGTHSRNRSLLTFDKPLTYEDSGYYECNVNNGVFDRGGVLDQSVKKYLAVMGVPKMLNNEKTTYGNIGQHVKVEALFYSVPEFTIATWFLESDSGKQDIVNSSLKIQQNVEQRTLHTTFHGVAINVTGYVATLLFKNMTVDNIGTYVVVIANDKGQANYTKKLEIKQNMTNTNKHIASRAMIGIVSGSAAGALIIIIIIIIVLVVLCKRVITKRKSVCLKGNKRSANQTFSKK